MGSFVVGVVPVVAQQGKLSPDNNAEHCAAFGGKWSENRCRERLEYQQSAIESAGGYKQFCKDRGGTWERVSRGWACSGTPYTQGRERYRIPWQELVNYSSFNDILSKCVNASRSWDCRVSDSTVTGVGFDYTNSNTDGLADVAVKAGINFVFDIGHFKYDHQRRLIHSAVKAVTQGKNSCAKACLLKCAASAVLSYATDSSGKPLKMYKAWSHNGLYDDRRGVCTEFAKIAADIGGNTDIPTKTVAGNGHAYNAFEIDGQWYYAEPQNDRCEFFHSPDSLKAYQMEFERQGRKYNGGWIRPVKIDKPHGRRQRVPAILPEEEVAH